MTAQIIRQDFQQGDDRRTCPEEEDGQGPTPAVGFRLQARQVPAYAALAAGGGGGKKTRVGDDERRYKETSIQIYIYIYIILADYGPSGLYL